MTKTTRQWSIEELIRNHAKHIMLSLPNEVSVTMGPDVEIHHRQDRRTWTVYIRFEIEPISP